MEVQSVWIDLYRMMEMKKVKQEKLLLSLTSALVQHKASAEEDRLDDLEEWADSRDHAPEDTSWAS